MRIISLLSALCLSITCAFSSGIEGISLENYPRMDGSTSTEPLNRVIAEYMLGTDLEYSIIDEVCGDTAQVTLSVRFKIGNSSLTNRYIVKKYRDYYNGQPFGYHITKKIYTRINCYNTGEHYLHEQEGVVHGENLPSILHILEEYCTWEKDLELWQSCEFEIEKVDTSFSKDCYYLREKYNPNDFFGVRVKSSQTHQSFNNLIDNQTDVILVARKMSEDEKAYAVTKGVTLIETPIALDAFVFLKNGNNSIQSLTIEQVIAIYTGQITNWNEVGGSNTAITPYIRNKNSGSQELMETLVMQGKTIPDWKEDLTIGAMDEVYRQIATDATGICYTVYYYDEFIMQPRPWVQGETEVKRIAINGVYPEYNTIKNKTYPFVAPVYAIIRSDLDKNSMAYKMYEWLQTNEGKSVIEQSGYIADLGTNITQIVNKNDIQIFPNPTSGIVYSSTAGTIKLYNLQGVLLQETFGSHIDLSAYTQGLYLLQVNDTWTKVLKK